MRFIPLKNSTNRYLILVFAVVFSLRAPGQTDKTSNGKDFKYAAVASERAAKIVGKLEVSDPVVSKRVEGCIINFYIALNDIHDWRDEMIVSLKDKGLDSATSKAGQIREKAENKTAKNHREFLKCLSRDLAPEEIDRVKDGITYGVLPVTYQGYLNLLPDLKNEQKEQIMKWLVEAREQAMDGGTSEEKHAWFGKYKGRINNYLSAQGYDLKKAENKQGQRSQVPSVTIGPDGRLHYTTDSAGNRIPDYSACGYMASEAAIPFVQPKAMVKAKSGDATDRIQKAIDYVSSLAPDGKGFRGAVILGKGIHNVSGRLVIRTSGIVIRGEGSGSNGTLLVAAGKDRETLIRIIGGDWLRTGDETKIIDGYVPVNANSFRVENPGMFQKGDRILIRRPSTKEWIDKLGMNEFGGETAWLGWKPGQRDVLWCRKILGITGTRIMVDAPLTTALDLQYGGGYVRKIEWPGRAGRVGIENLELQSEYNPANPKEEQHCWSAITFENAEDGWVRQVVFRHFAGSAVAVFETSQRITVEDCISLAPVSEIAGHRRNTFFTMGQQTLFQRLFAEHGIHDFSTGFCAAGPNAFVQCESHLPFGFSGAADSWASGLLFDIVNVDGQFLSFRNRGQDAQGAGWCAAFSMFWQCSAAKMECYAPPGAYNWAYGAWAQYAGNGAWVDPNNHIRPRSLFYAQLAERLEVDPNTYPHLLLEIPGSSTTSPTVAQAGDLTRMADQANKTLKEWIEEASVRNPLSKFDGDIPETDDLPFRQQNIRTQNDPIRIENGWLTAGNGVATGTRIHVPFWRGDARPYATTSAQPSVTRFVPGRAGPGYTDILEDLTDSMIQMGIRALEHHYGLWYDRRRDDHERVRRQDGEVWAPFYELPFDRSGINTAWDGLSRYDLTKYNDWYWARLKQFAGLADRKGLILIHHHYFQHNILEAGAHWADFPWRTSNNINNTGFPEPPPYAGDKRIFMDEQFYDVNHPVRQELHRAYIRKCISHTAGNEGVLHLVSAEYTGPLHFMKFWLDVIGEWEQETGKQLLIGLSATKDVQDSILADPVRSALIGLVDIRHWCYRADGTLYAPEGGLHLAPRQHARLVNPGPRSFDQVYRAVSDYRMKYPEKPVIFSEGDYNRFPWAVFMAGGSLPALPPIGDSSFLKDATGMKPMQFQTGNGTVKALGSPVAGYILYMRPGDRLKPELAGSARHFRLRKIDPLSGQIIHSSTVSKGNNFFLANETAGELVFWLKPE